jgi:hypothetical protein
MRALTPVVSEIFIGIFYLAIMIVRLIGSSRRETDWPAGGLPPASQPACVVDCLSACLLQV